MRLFTKLAKGSGYNPNRGAGGRFTSGGSSAATAGFETNGRVAGQPKPTRAFGHGTSSVWSTHNTISAMVDRPQYTGRNKASMQRVLAAAKEKLEAGDERAASALMEPLVGEYERGVVSRNTRQEVRNATKHREIPDKKTVERHVKESWADLKNTLGKLSSMDMATSDSAHEVEDYMSELARRNNKYRDARTATERRQAWRKLDDTLKLAREAATRAHRTMGHALGRDGY